MSIFDPEAMLNSAISGSNDTRIAPIPAGEYSAVIDGIELKAPKQADQSPRLEVTWVINDGALAAELGRDRVQIRQSVFLDTTPDGRIDMGKGKNIRLGRLREATGHNDPSKPFTLTMLRGSLAKIKVTQRPDPQDPATVYNDVAAVTSSI